MFSFDLETSSLNFLDAKILCIGISWKEHFGVAINWEILQQEPLFTKFKEIMLSNKLKVNQNIKFDIQMLLAQKVPIKGPFFDTISAHNVLDENSDHSLEHLVFRYLPDMGEYWGALEKVKRAHSRKNKIKLKEFTYDLLPVEVLYPYAARDADAAFRLTNKFIEELIRQDLKYYYDTYVIPFMQLILRMEYRGIKINREKLKSLIDASKAQLAEEKTKLHDDEAVTKFERIRKKVVERKLTKEYNEKKKKYMEKFETGSKQLKSRHPDGAEAYAEFRLKGTAEDHVQKKIKKEQYEVNFNSPMQLADLFFTHMGLPSVKKTDKGNESTDVEVMGKLASDGIVIAKNILKVRELQKYISTYLVSVYEKSEIDGRIHATYLQHRTTTGRLCVDKNTEILTNHGTFRISELPLTNYQNFTVQSHLDRPCKILNVFYKGKENMYKVKLVNGSEIICTEGHRFLTPKGWRSLENGCAIGVEVCIENFSKFTRNEREEQYINQRKLYKSSANRGMLKKRSKGQIQYFKQTLDMFNALLSGGIRKRNKKNKKQEIFKSDDGKYSWEAGKAKCINSKKSIERLPNKKDGTLRNCKNFQYNGMVCKKEHRISRIRKAKFGSPKSSFKYKSGIFKKVGFFSSKDLKRDREVLRGSYAIFQPIVRSIYKSKRTNLVHKNIFKGSCLLYRKQTNIKKPYMLVNEPLRNVTFFSTITQKYSTYKTKGNIQKLYNRFCFPTNKVISRSRWIISSNRQKYTRERQEKRGIGEKVGLYADKGYRQRYITRDAKGFKYYKTSIITSITPVGIREVWDIEVENDHSYCAQGFINHNSSKSPNMQNIPRDAKAFKSCFVANKGYIFVKADLAQAEFRCWAHYANDEDMIAAIEGGLDIHRQTAAEVFSVKEDEVTSDQRTAAKNAVFGLIYGRGSEAIANQYDLTIEQAEAFKRTFFSRYPIAAYWLEGIVKHAKDKGYVQSWFGRKRRLPGIYSAAQEIRAEAERQAKNAPIQTQASDMNNMYMLKTLKAAKEQGVKCFPVTTVHDANFFSVKESQKDDLICIMKDVVENTFPDFKCKMKLDFEVGYTLGTLEEIE
jgi:DNA polymerase I-like protein with 3'-5' exonuclease and polymerase domains